MVLIDSAVRKLNETAFALTSMLNDDICYYVSFFLLLIRFMVLKIFLLPYAIYLNIKKK